MYTNKCSRKLSWIHSSCVHSSQYFFANNWFFFFMCFNLVCDGIIRCLHLFHTSKNLCNLHGNDNTVEDLIFHDTWWRHLRQKKKKKPRKISLITDNIPFLLNLQLELRKRNKTKISQKRRINGNMCKFFAESGKNSFKHSKNDS